MSGLGRRSQYRKHLTDSVLHELPEPSETEEIAKIVASRGGNQFDIVTPDDVDKPQLALLPTKFHKVVWVKRNDYVIVECGEKEDDEDAGGVRFIINHILYKDQIAHLVKNNLWPEAFHDGATVQKGTLGEEVEGDNDETVHDETADDGIVYDQGYNDDDQLFVNTNRLAALRVDESESESDDD